MESYKHLWGFVPFFTALFIIEIMANMPYFVVAAGINFGVGVCMYPSQAFPYQMSTLAIFWVNPMEINCFSQKPRLCWYVLTIETFIDNQKGLF